MFALSGAIVDGTRKGTAGVEGTKKGTAGDEGTRKGTASDRIWKGQVETKTEEQTLVSKEGNKKDSKVNMA